MIQQQYAAGTKQQALVSPCPPYSPHVSNAPARRPVRPPPLRSEARPLSQPVREAAHLHAHSSSITSARRSVPSPPTRTAGRPLPLPLAASLAAGDGDAGLPEEAGGAQVVEPAAEVWAGMARQKDAAAGRHAGLRDGRGLRRRSI